jgi:hypothetical protein
VSLFRQSIEEYLDELELFAPESHALGIELFEAGAVRGIQINPGNGEIEAEVISGKRSKPCHVRLMPLVSGQELEVVCSGPCFPLGCQHGAAFLLALLVQLECPPGTPVQTPVPEGTPIAPDPSTMAGSVSLRLGGVVPPVIQGMLPILEGWWQARLQNVPLMNLMRLVEKH